MNTDKWVLIGNIIVASAFCMMIIIGLAAFLVIVSTGCAALDRLVSDVNTVGNAAGAIASAPGTPMDIRLIAESMAGACAGVAGIYVVVRRLTRKVESMIEEAEQPPDDTKAA
jgi:ABC-type uncharacterized transport system permease subunit